MRRAVRPVAYTGVLIMWVAISAGCSAVTHSPRPPTRVGDMAAASHDAEFVEHTTAERTARADASVRSIAAELVPVISPANDAAEPVSWPTIDVCRSPHDVSWEIDKSRFLPDFRGDLESLVSRQNALLLLAAGGVSYAFHEHLDDDIAENTARHANRWGRVQNVFDGIGNPVHHLAAASGLYAYSLWSEDVETHELSKSLLSAVAITGVSSTLLKVAANSTRPNGDSGGWPSGHVSSSVAVAAVLDEYYGHAVGIPVYLLAALVAWERIDDREHDLSDVVFGAALGYVIGRSIAAEHQIRFGGMQLEPFVDPATGSSGISLERRY